MATLNTLRTKGGLIVSIVIGLALVAFLLGDLVGGNSVFGVKEKVGTIDGTQITYLEYAQEIDRITEINKILSNSESLTAEQSEQIRNIAWEGLVNTYAIYPGFEALGIEVTEAEMLDRIYGNNISPVLINAGFFNNSETGAYDKTLVQQFVSSYNTDPTGRMGMIWDYIKDQVRQEAMTSKFLALTNGMVYVTDAETTRGGERANAFYNANYVVQNYETIPDSLVKVASSDVRKFYDARKHLFKQAASRDVEYVVFDVVPSNKDFSDTEALITELANEFATTDNVQQYVTLNSQEPFNPAYFSREQLPADLAEYAFSKERAAVFGPMLQNETYTVSRVSDMRTFPDTIAFRQMAFAPGTEALADSLFNELQRGRADFMTVAGEYSLIPVAEADAGRMSTSFIPMEIGQEIYSTRDRLIKTASPNGTFIMDVYYRGPESAKVQLASVVQHVEPSALTQQAAYAKASGFFTGTAGLQDNFNKIAADSVYSKRVARINAGDAKVNGLENGRELVRWAFNSKPGSISNIMEIDGNYLVATLVSAHEAGYSPIDQVSVQIAAELRRDKKADLIAEKMKGASSLDALAQTLSTEVGEIEELNYNAFYVPEIGMEPVVIGAVCGGVPQGSVSKPVKGASGVYVVEVTSKDVREETTPEMERVRLEAADQNYLAQRTLQAMFMKSDVVDGRAKYF